MLSICIIKEIFGYIHNDYHLIISKNNLEARNDETKQLLPITLILDSKLHLYYHKVLLSSTKFSATFIIEIVISNNHYDILKWLLQQDRYQCAILIDSIIERACCENNIILLKTLKEIGINSINNVKYSYLCAKHGNIDILIFLHDNGCHFNKYTINSAALGGKLDVIQYLRSLVDSDDDMQWDKSTIASASYYGSLDIIIYLLSKGCDWDTNCYRESINAGHHHIVRWSLENGCQWSVFDN